MTKKRVDPPLEEQDPILTEGITVTIAGQEYQMDRLGLRHTFRVSRILGSGISMLIQQGKINTKEGEEPQIDEGLMMQVLIAAISRNEEEVLQLIADLLVGVERKDLDDAGRFPMDSLFDIYEALAQHQDVVGFLLRVQGLMRRRPEMQQAANGATP